MQLIAGPTSREYNQRKGSTARSGKIGITPRLFKLKSTHIAA
jgi:hypothetical protein